MSVVKFKNTNLRPLIPSFVDDFFIDDFFPVMNFKKESIPPTNIEENEKEFSLEIAIPGMTKDDINVEVDNGRLRVFAEKEISSEESEKNYTRKEYGYNSFERSFTLPENVTGSVSAKYSNGILHIVLPKKAIEVTKAKKIKVA